MDEIPTALREIRNTTNSTSIKIKLNFPLILSLIGLGLMGILLVSFKSFSNQVVSNSSTNELQANVKNTVTEKTSNNKPNSNTSGQNSDQLAVNAENSTNIVHTEHILGHLPYEEAKPSELTAITSDGRLKLRTAAAEKFIQMQNAARQNGINLVPLSGYRSIKEQEYLFFEIQRQRSQVPTQRAEVSAPPRHSEHHTGYAIDIGDGKVPSTHLSPNFDKTAAYKWLQKNAAKYSFELSFTPDNLQGISYEPWHWRFVGDTHSLETFYKAKNLKSNLND